jgi:putative thioredoxin
MDEIEKIKKDKLKKMLLKRKIDLIIEVNDKNFQEKVIKQSKKIPVVVDFWSPWCVPCLILGPVLEKLNKEYNGKFILAKVNVSENRLVGQKYGIMGIPSVKMFKDGKITDEFVGTIPELLVRKWLDKNIK